MKGRWFSVKGGNKKQIKNKLAKLRQMFEPCHCFSLFFKLLLESSRQN